MAANELSRLLESLHISEEPVAVLEEIKTVSCSVHPSVLSECIRNISFNFLFDLLGSENREQIDLCCEVLSKLLTALGPADVLQSFRTELLEGLDGPNLATKRLCLKQLKNIAEELLDQLSRQDVLVHKLINLLADQCLEVSELASSILTCFGRTLNGLMALYNTHSVQSLQSAMDTSDTIRFRVYELLVNISSQSLAALQHTDQSGLLQQLFNEVYKDDILVQLNSIELLSNLSMTEHGLVHLDQLGIIKKLEDIMSSMDNNPMAGLLLPGLIKFFGGVAKFHPKEICSGNELFVRSVFDNLTSDVETECSIAMQTIGFIGSTVEGKAALEKLGGRMEQALPLIGNRFTEGRSEHRVTALQCAQNLLRLKVDDQTVELLSLTEKWFSCLSHRAFEMLLSISQQPFVELRCNAHKVLTSISMQPWGQRMMKNFPGFCEYLMDRMSENSKEGRDSKFELIRTLAESPTSMDIFGQQYHVKLKAYVLQGPYFVQAQSEVAFEGE